MKHMALHLFPVTTYGKFEVQNSVRLLEVLQMTEFEPGTAEQ